MNIHPTAIISKKARIGKNVSIGPFCIIHENVIIGDDSVIHAYCELGLTNRFTDERPLLIGHSALIRSHSTFYTSSSFGSNLTTGHSVKVREGVVAGDGLQLGTFCEVQGACTFGNHTKLQSNIVIGQKTEIGNYVWIFPYVIATNDPHPPSEHLIGVTISDFAVIATRAVLLPGVHIGSDTLIGAGAIVTRDVEPFSVVTGNPARRVCGIDEVTLKDGSGGPAYPWRRHFHRGYPADDIQKWLAEFSST